MAKIKAKKTENEIKSNVKKKKFKEPKIRTEEGETLHRLIIIFIVIILVVILVYVISALISKENKNDNTNTTNTSTEAKIDYDKVSVGMILNRNQYNKYYVMVYDADSINAIYYSTLITQYNAKEEHDKLFFCDLSNPLNKDYAKEESNPKAQKTEDFAFGEVTLLQIQNGKITRYIEDIETIEEILQ